MDKEMGEAVAGYWRAVGLRVEFYPESRTSLFPKLMALKMRDPTLIGNGNGLLRAEFPFELWLQSRQKPMSRGAAYASPHPVAGDETIKFPLRCRFPTTLLAMHRGAQECPMCR